MSYDDKGFRWLHIRNWKKYQPDARIRNKTARLKYVLDHTDKLDNADFQKLTYFQRFLFEGICLLVGTRPSRSVLNDPTWIAHALHTQRTDMPHVGHALSTLILQGYLIPTNTENFFEESGETPAREGEGEGEGEGKGEGEGVGPIIHSVSYEEADASQKEEQEEAGFVVVDSEVAVHDLPCFTLLHEEFGRETELPEETVRRVHSALKALNKNEAWMQGCIQYTAKHRWWKDKIAHAEAFAKALINGINDPIGKKLPAQYDHYVAQRRRAAGAGKR